MYILKAISRGSIYLLVFLTPLFFSPLTQNVLDFQKQTFFLVVALLGLMGWVSDALISKKLVFNFNLASVAVVAVMLATLVSSLFSLYSYGSLWGLPLDISASFLTVTGFVLFYFLIINLFGREELGKLLYTLVFSSFIAALYGILQLFGLFIMPFDFTKIASFNTLGSINGLGLFLAAILIAVFAMVLSEKNKVRLGLLAFTGAVLFLYLVLVNFLAAWIILAFGALVIFIQSFVDRDSFSRGTTVAAASFVLLFASLIFVALDVFAADFIRDFYKGFPQTPVEISLSDKASWDITGSTLKSSAKNLFLGSGPGTYVYDYSKFKPEMINQTNFWSIRFGTASSEMLGRLATVGILGVLFFVALIGFIAVKGFKMLNEDREDKELIIACYASWLAMVIALFLYPLNFTLTFLFWLLTALIIGFNDDKKKEIEFSLGSKAAYAAPLLLVVVLAFQLGIIVWVGKRYFAEVKYLQAMQAVQRQDFLGAVNDLNLAISSTESAQDNYLRDLAQVYLAWVRQEISTSTDQKQTLELIAPLMGRAVEIAKVNTDSVNGNDANNWAVRGYVYRELIGAVKDADSWAVTSYKRAIDLEPASSYYYVELAQVYILKEDQEAAKESLLKAVELNPSYSNARYYLGLIYDKEGKKEEAIDQFAVVAQLNPDNENILKILENLKAGKPAMGELASIPAPDLNNPPAGNEVNSVPSENPAVIAPEGGKPAENQPVQ
jgi:tetratricopeptide (TPR) repeat protein